MPLRRGQKVRLKPGAEKTVSVTLAQKQGALRVKAKNAQGDDVKADVYVEGKRLGSTPGRFKVSVCAQQMEVRSKKFGTVTKALEVRERKVTPIDVTLAGGGTEMALVPGGLFFMGCDEKRDPKCEGDEKPGRTIFLDGFEIDKSEVSVKQYQKCVNKGKCKKPHWDDGKCRVFNKGKWKNGTLPKRFRGRNHPVVCVDWTQARQYCEWLGKRLPTEAEWEKAARGKDRRMYPWGNSKGTCKQAIMDDGGNGCGKDSTWPVCSKVPGKSPYGVCDMAGSVWEWVADWDGKEYYARGAKMNPKGPPGGKYRGVRGGSWYSGIEVMGVTNRSRRTPDVRCGTLGFRCARSVP